MEIRLTLLLDSDNSLLCTCVFFQRWHSLTASSLWRKTPQGEARVCQPCWTILTKGKPSEFFFKILNQFTIKACQRWLTSFWHLKTISKINLKFLKNTPLSVKTSCNKVNWAHWQREILFSGKILSNNNIFTLTSSYISEYFYHNCTEF